MALASSAARCAWALVFTGLIACQTRTQTAADTPGHLAAPATDALRGSETPTGIAEAAPSAAAVAHPDIGFRSSRLLREHYEKHGREFGEVSPEAYLRLAQSLRDASPGGDVLETTRADGVISRFDRATGSFIAFNRDLTIRTFFRPNDGEAYFRRQARRRPAA